MNKKLIKRRAKEMRKQLGGRIFAFPINELDPHSLYALCIKTDNGWLVYDEELSVEEAAQNVLATLEEFKKALIPVSYEKDVRFTFTDNQLNAPNLTMHRVKKQQQKEQTPFHEEGIDYSQGRGEELLITGRGILKFSYTEMVQEKNPVGIAFMERYFKLLTIKGYGKDPKAIEIELANKNMFQAKQWLEKTFEKYGTDNDMFEILNQVKRRA